MDLYAFQAIKAAFIHLDTDVQTLIYQMHWGMTAMSMLALFVYHFVDPKLTGSRLRTTIMLGIFTIYISKFFLIFFVIFDDLRRLLLWIWEQMMGNPSATIGRSALLAQIGLAISSIPLVAIIWGVVQGAHHYQVVKRKVYLPNLPVAFDGLRIAQISDIHAGTFWDKKAVQHGVDLLVEERPDVVFFTGDLVNNKASEMEDFMDVFAEIQAPLGVYATLGNHDYGDYIQWPNIEAKRQNLQDLIGIHAQMGWQILMNEHKILEREGQQIAVLGIENWSAKGNFPKYGSLSDAYRGTEDIPVKLLLSHDPSHWKAQVIPNYPDIDLTFSGHTHGMQFGLDSKYFKWSPVKYVYKEWIDLYREADQYLYVNRGFGYLGFPGRIGMRPEITLIELKVGRAD